MSLTQRTILLTIAGALAGGLLWFALIHAYSLLGGSTVSSNWGVRIRVGLLAGLFFGVCLGAADALTLDCLPRRCTSLLCHFLTGLIGAVVAMSIHPILPTSPIVLLADPSSLHVAPVDRVLRRRCPTLCG